MRVLSVVLLLFAFETISSAAFSLDLSVTGPAVQSGSDSSFITPIPDFEKAYKRNRLMQVMGYAMLATSAVLTITGAALVQGSPWGPVARTGVIFFGTGLVHFVSAACLLGFSKVIIRQEMSPLRPVKIIRKDAYRISKEGDIYF